MDFGDFALEEFFDEFAAGARDDQARAEGVDVHLEQQGVDPVAGHVLFIVNLLLGGHDSFRLLEVDDDVAGFKAADGAVDDLPDAVGELLLHVLLLRLAELLNDRLARGLSGDAPEVARSDLPLDDVAELHIRETFPGPFDDQLIAGRIAFHHFEHGPRLDLPGGGVDFHLEFAGRMNALARCGQNGALQRPHQTFAADSALLLDIFENRQ